MRLTRLACEGFRSYGELDLSLESVHAAAILGRNGAGKSSLLAAVEWALYGAGSIDSIMRDDARRTVVIVEVAQGEDRWRVTRGRDRKRGAWLALDRLGDDERSFSCRTIAETQQRIVEHVTGMSAEAYRATVYAPQGEAGMLSALPPARRKELLAGLLGLERYERWRAQASMEARDAVGQVTAIVAERDRLAAQLLDARQAAGDPDAIAEAVKQATADVAAAEEQVTLALAAHEAHQQVALRESLLAQMAALRERGRVAREAHHRIRQLDQHLDRALQVRALFEREDARRQEYEARVAAVRAEHDAQRRVRARLERDLAAARADLDRAARAAQTAFAAIEDHERRIAALDADDARCDLCGQAVHDEALATARATLEAQRASLAARHDEAHAAQARAIERSEQLAADLAALPKDDDEPAPSAPLGDFDPERYKSLRADLEALNRLAGERDSLGEPEDVDKLKRAWTDVRQRAVSLPKTAPEGPDPHQARLALSEAQARLRTAEARAAAAGEQRALAERLAARDAELAEGLPALERRAAALGVLAGAFGRNGIPALILDNATGALEAHANEALDALGGGMRLRIATQRTTKAGGISETLDIVVDDGAHERPLEVFSGGERYRVHIALRLGLAAALAAADGRGCELLALDEPTDLDDDGMVALGRLLAAMPQQVLVVSHSERLIDTMPTAIRVARAEHGDSRVTVS